ncbi:hypothetical protein FRC17_009200 [Serendipita sp. 399]|nr:hypothetical protein FRC17_009200 [Serendipita sp. 399]
MFLFCTTATWSSGADERCSDTSTFAYNLNWASVQMPAGTPLSSTVTVGSFQYTHNFGASDAGWLLYSSSTTSLGDPFTHTGTTSLLKSADGTIGYIPITIDFPYTRTAGASCRAFMKGAAFHITSPTSSSASSAGSPNTPVAGTVTRISSSSSLLSSVTLPAISQQSNAAATVAAEDTGVDTLPSTSASSSSPVLAQHSSPPTGAIIGGVVGGIALLGIFALILLLLYKKKIRELKTGEPDLLTYNTNTTTTGGNGDGDSTKGPMRTASFDPFATYPASSPMGQTMSSIEPLHTASTTLIPLPFRPIETPFGNRGFDIQRQQQQRRAPREGQTTNQQGNRPLSGDTSVAGTGAEAPPAYSAVHSASNSHRHGEEDEDDEEEYEYEEGEDEEYDQMSPSQFGDGSSQVASSARVDSIIEGGGGGVGSDTSHQARRRQQERFSAFVLEKNRRSWNLPPIPSHNPNPTTATNTTTTGQNTH